MKYTLKNLKLFFKKEKMIFILVLICVVTSSFIINFSYGLYQNYNVIKEEEESQLYEFEVPFLNKDEAYASKEVLKNTVLSFTDSLNNSIEMYLVKPYSDEVSADDYGDIFVRFCVNNGEIAPCELFRNNMDKNGTLISGDYFTAEQEAAGEKVAMVFDDLDTDPSITKKLMINENTILFQGEEFEIIGIQRMHALIIPFESLDDNTIIKSALFRFDKPVTRSQYNEIKEKLEINFPGIAQVPELDIPEAENYYLYNTIILISVLIAVLAAINFAVLYRYILSKRTKNLAIFRVCGCTKAKALCMYLAECMIIAIPLFALTTFAYDRFALPILSKHFEYMEAAYSVKLYLLIFGIYIAATLIVLMLMISGFLRKNIREAKEER